MDDALLMRGIVFALLCASLLGCEYREPGMSSADIQAFAASHPGMTQTCLDDVRWGRRNWGDATPRNGCFEMEPAKRWRGLWDSGWEWSIFCAESARNCRTFPEKGDSWLVFSDGAYKGPHLQDGLYEIEFVGRRTAKPAYFGHLDQYDYEMVVDRMIAIRMIRPEPRD
jgi:hypothetical protein